MKFWTDLCDCYEFVIQQQFFLVMGINLHQEIRNNDLKHKLSGEAVRV